MTLSSEEHVKEPSRHPVYEHYKGKKYLLLMTGKHSETLEEYVVYQALYTDPEFGEGQIWIRPKDMFFGTVEVQGKMVMRFRKIEHNL